MVSPANVPVRTRGARTQNRILEKAVHIASVEGLASMSLATLAKATAMSKSGLFAHFRSKEALQIAVVEEAERIFYQLVVAPSLAEPNGLPKVASLFRGYAEYAARGPFAGGCFFCAASHEFDGRPGPVRDRIAAFYGGFDVQLRTALTEAARTGQLAPAVDVSAVIFDVKGIALAANMHAQMGPGPQAAMEMARRAVTALINRIASIN